MRTLLELMKVRITVVVTLTTATGYFLGPADLFDQGLGMALLGIFLLAAGSAALNHAQDAPLDARMTRTRSRPIPSGRVDRTTTVFIAVVLAGLGAAMLASLPRNPYQALILGLVAMAWYNGVYAYLKRATPFAVVPGSVIGAIPPVIGFVAAGGDIADPYIHIVAGFFFMWQIPHFWLLLLMFGEQYGKAGLPTLTRVFARPQLLRVTALWIMATAVAGISLAVAVLADMNVLIKLALIAASLWLAWHPVRMLLEPEERAGEFRRAFLRINAYALAVMVCLSVSGLA